MGSTSDVGKTYRPSAKERQANHSRTVQIRIKSDFPTSSRPELNLGSDVRILGRQVNVEYENPIGVRGASSRKNHSPH